MPEGLQTLDIVFNESNLVLLNIALAVVMFGVALGLRVQDFHRLIEQPRLPLIGLTSQWILLPLWTVLLLVGVQPESGLALGMILVACCPGGNVSNFLADLSKGNAALSVTLTLVSSLLAALLTPMIFGAIVEFLPELSGPSKHIAVNLGGMARLIVLTVALPLLAGMALNHWAPAVANTIRAPARWLSLVILGTLIGVTIYANAEHFVEYVGLVFVIVLIHNAGAFFVGWSWSKLMKVEEYDRKAITIETGIQNSGLGLIIIFNFFDGYGPMALIAAWWGVWHLISGLTLSIYWRRSSR